MPIRLSSTYVANFAQERLGQNNIVRQDLLDVASLFENLGNLPRQEVGGELRLTVLNLLNRTLSAAKRLIANESSSLWDFEDIGPLELFSLIHFVSTETAFIRSLQSISSRLIIEADPESDQSSSRRKSQAHNINEAIDDLVETASTAELAYSFAVAPNDEIKPFIELCTRSFMELIVLKGGKWSVDYQEKMNCLEESLKQYSLWITSDSRAAIWVSGYLNYNHQQAAISTIQRDVSSVDQAFKNWLKRPNEAVGRRVAAWQNYREKMIELPDDKETMFAENFGVRKVFVQPLASYKVAGMKRDTGVIVPDVANLLATLLSDRTNGEDLIVLCGGPGSGKSTLCRILASQLAHNDQVNPVFLRLRRLQDGQDTSSIYGGSAPKRRCYRQDY